MIATRVSQPRRRVQSAGDVAGIFLTPDGRLPGFAQRRLDDLIAKKRTEGLTLGGPKGTGAFVTLSGGERWS